MARVDMPGIKSAIQTILEGANTTTGSPIDLSDSMTNRVRQVFQVDVEKIPIQPSMYPCITMFYDRKAVALQDISRTMLEGKRRADIDLKVVGICWIDDINTANYQYKDLADNECERLMENIEQVLRSDPTLGGKALWSAATDVTYHTYKVMEGSHFRTGLMNFKITVFY